MDREHRLDADDHSARPGQGDELLHRGAGVGQVHEDETAEDEVEYAARQAGIAHVGLDELHVRRHPGAGELELRRGPSTPVTAPAGLTSPASRAVTAPGPQPTSTARMPGARPALRSTSRVAGANAPASRFIRSTPATPVLRAYSPLALTSPRPYRSRVGASKVPR